MTTAVQSNSMPAGGPTAQQPVQPTVQPADIAALQDMLTPTITKFRDQSVFQWAPLPQMNLSAGQQSFIQISNLGLGVLMVATHTVTFYVTNTTAGSFNIGPTFPYNLLNDTSVQINGGATTYTCPGYEGLLAAVRNRRGILKGAGRLDGVSGGLNPALVRMTFGSGLTPTYNARGGNNFCGVASVAVGANTTNAAMTVTFTTIEKLAKDFDTLVGALPLQNSSTYATISRTPTGTFTSTSGTGTAFNSVGATITIALNSWTVATQYCYASVPTDPTLYADMIGNSYQVNCQRALPLTATGSQALQYNIPNNHYLTALHVVVIDGNGSYLVPLTAFSNFRMQYSSGGVVPLQQTLAAQYAKALLDYESYQGDLPGYLMWDGNATSDQISLTDAMGWLDCYQVSQPQFLADIASGTVVPATFTATRESVVVGSVQVIGG